MSDLSCDLMSSLVPSCYVVRESSESLSPAEEMDSSNLKSQYSTQDFFAS